MSTATDSTPQSKAPNGTRGGRGGSFRGSRGRGRGRTRTTSTGSAVSDMASPVASPAEDKAKPSLLSRLDIKPDPPILPASGKGRLAKLAVPSAQASPTSPTGTSPSSPKTPTGRNARKGKPPAASSVAVNVVSPSSPGPSLSAPTPVTATGKSPLSQVVQSDASNLPKASETDAKPSEVSLPQPHTLLEQPHLAAGLLPPSLIPSPRPFTPSGRDWAADGEEDDEGDLPSLDDWGLPDVKAESVTGNSEVKQAASAMGKLSLSTGAENSMAGNTSSPSRVPIMAAVIPPTPVAPNPLGRSIKGAASRMEAPPSPDLGMTLGNSTSGPVAQTHRAGRAFSRPNSPLPLNLVRRDSLSGRDPRSQSPGPGGTSPRPTSGGVGLGFSRPNSPAPGSPSFNTLELRPSSPGFLGSRPGSPAMSASGRASPGAHRPLSGGVSLGMSRPSSPAANASRPNSPRPNQATFGPQRSATLETPSDWRRSPARQTSELPPILMDSPLPATGPAKAEQTPPTGPLASRLSTGPSLVIPPYRGGLGRGGLGTRGTYRGRFNHPLAQVHGPASPSSPRGRGGSFAGRSDKDNAPSPTAQSPRSPIARGGANRGHGRTPSGSRPIISSLAISRLGETLGSPPKKGKASPPVDI